MHKAKTADLDDAFTQAVTNAVTDIHAKLVPKHVGGRNMSGAAFCKFLEQVVITLNSPMTSMQLSIPDEYKKTVQFVAQKAVREGLSHYKTVMGTKMAAENLPMAWDRFNEIHAQCFAEALEHFNGKILGSLEQVVDFSDNLRNEVTERVTHFRKENSAALTKHATTVAKNQWSPIIARRLKPGTSDTFASHEELVAAQETFEEEFNKHIIPSPEAANVLNAYREIQYSEAQEQLRLLGLYNEQLANQRKLELKHKEEQLKHAAQVQELKNKVDQQQKETQEQMKAAESAFKKMQHELESQKKSNERIASLAQAKDTQIAKLEERMKVLAQKQSSGSNGSSILDDVLKIVTTVATVAKTVFRL